MYALPKPSFRPHSTRGTLQTLKRSTTTPLWSSKSASATPIFGGAHPHLPLRRFFVATGSKSQAVASTEAHGRKINPNEPGKVSSNDTPAIAHTLARHPKDFPLTIGGAPGRNLSEQWIQKERSLRKKQGLVKQFEELQDGCQTEDISTSEDTVVPPAEALSSAAVTFKGFVIPQEPKPPADDECCMSGCAICVYDLYEDSLDTYDEAVRSVQANLRALGVADAEWPESIRPSADTDKESPGGAGAAKARVLSAFEELERSLQAKQTS